jgi:hypothetical protein
MTEFVLALIQAIFPWATLWVLAKYFLMARRQDIQKQERLLSTVDDLTAQIVAFKNPWAAEMFARTQSLQQQRGAPPVKDEGQLRTDLERELVGIGEEDLA